MGGPCPGPQVPPSQPTTRHCRHHVSSGAEGCRDWSRAHGTREAQRWQPLCPGSVPSPPPRGHSPPARWLWGPPLPLPEAPQGQQEAQLLEHLHLPLGFWGLRMETERPSPQGRPKSQEQLQGSDTGIREAEVEVCRGQRSAEACFPKTATRWVFAILSSRLSPAAPCPGSLPCPYTLQVGLGACSSAPLAPFVSNAVMHRFVLAPCSSWRPQCLA